MRAPLDLTVPLALGTAWFDAADPAGAAASIETYLAAGGRVLDTARVYRASEDVIGAWLRVHGDVPGLRLLTKGGHPDPADWLPRLARADVLADARTSAALLGRPADLYLLHRDDTATPVDEIADTLRAVVDEGLAPAVGVSNWSLERTRALDDALADRDLGVTAVSDYLGLAVASAPPGWAGSRSLDAATLAWAEETTTAQLSWSSQSGGYFAGAYRGGQFAGAENERRRTELDRVAAAADVPPAALLVRWSATVSPQIVPVVASRSPERLARHLADARDGALDPAVDALIRAIDPSGALGRSLIAPGAVW